MVCTFVPLLICINICLLHMATTSEIQLIVISDKTQNILTLDPNQHMSLISYSKYSQVSSKCIAS